jgi:hypothetical protein
MNDAKARLRKTFKYPSDTEEDSSVSRDELDEEGTYHIQPPLPVPTIPTHKPSEQSTLITSLSTTASQNDSTYRLIFTALPLLSIIPFLWHLLIHPSRSTALPALLSMTSLCITSWGMYSVPLPSSLSSNVRTRPSTIFAPSTSGTTSTSISNSRAAEFQGPLLTHLPRLNVLIAVLLLGVSCLFSSRTDVNGSEGFWLLLLLPAVMWGVVFVVKASMLEIQSGLGELEGLKYEYKGA